MYEIGGGQGQGEPVGDRDLDDDDGDRPQAQQLGKGAGVVAMHGSEKIVGKVINAYKKRLDAARFELIDGQFQRLKGCLLRFRACSMQGEQGAVQGAVGADQAGVGPEPIEERRDAAVDELDELPAGDVAASAREALRALAAKGKIPGLPENISKNHAGSSDARRNSYWFP